MFDLTNVKIVIKIILINIEINAWLLILFHKFIFHILS